MENPDWRPVDYAGAVTWLDQQLDQVADEAWHVLITEAQLSEDARHAAMQRIYLGLDAARARGMAEIQAHLGPLH